MKRKLVSTGLVIVIAALMSWCDASGRHETATSTPPPQTYDAQQLQLKTALRALIGKQWLDEDSLKAIENNAGGLVSGYYYKGTVEKLRAAKNRGDSATVLKLTNELKTKLELDTR